MHDLFRVLRILFGILLRFLLFFSCKLGTASTPFMIIESSKTTRFPSIKPMIDCQTTHIKNMHKIMGHLAIKAEENTMSALSDTVMLTLFIASAEQMLCLKTEV